MYNKDSDIQNLKGKILLSTSSISNEYIEKSMVFVCSHDQNGAVGVIINKLIPDMSVYSILRKLRIITDGVEDLEIHFGGLDEMNKCFILHSDDYMTVGSQLIVDSIAITKNEDIIRVVTSSGGPEKKILCMGCCVWIPEQLENEVASSYWVPIDADEALIFGDPKADKWSKALLKIGSSTNLFSSLQGNA